MLRNKGFRRVVVDADADFAGWLRLGIYKLSTSRGQMQPTEQLHAGRGAVIRMTKAATYPFNVQHMNSTPFMLSLQYFSGYPIITRMSISFHIPPS